MSVYRNSSETENSGLNLQSDKRREKAKKQREKERRDIPAESPKVKRGSNCIIFQTKRTNREREREKSRRRPRGGRAQSSQLRSSLTFHRN